ncbi:MAG: hypothetical protein LBR83_01050 [Clostridiales bacterium]|nr:hypothetical protein [Clostridiales bacterium]
MPYSDVTLTFISVRRPKTVLDMLNAQKQYTVTEKYPGIFEVTGLPFPTRIVASGRLEADNGLWLGLLRKNITRKEFISFAKRDTAVREQIETSAFWYVVKDMVQEDIERSGLEMYGGLEKVIDEAAVEYGWDKKWIAEGIAEGKDRGKRNTLAIVKGLLNNIALEQLAMETNTPIEEIEAIKLELLPV